MTQENVPPSPRAVLDAAAVKTAYKRWANMYDAVFGGISMFGRKQAVHVTNHLPGKTVLEVGVGTGLALPFYRKDLTITGIDLSGEMLDKARERVKEQKLENIAALHEMDAEQTSFEDNAFDIAVAMFVASVVPHPRQLLAELKRVVKPGGHILFVNHFIAKKGIRLFIEKNIAWASHSLGWHPDFAMESLLPEEDMQRAVIRPVPPAGLFTLITLENVKTK
ncbi:class I SAM-dependent methyltransferase [Entomobacter blattae]|nr:class I SAM-dependent methyltransferase [Entomobacter blattae]